MSIQLNIQINIQMSIQLNIHDLRSINSKHLLLGDHTGSSSSSQESALVVWYLMKKNPQKIDKAGTPYTDGQIRYVKRREPSHVMEEKSSHVMQEKSSHVVSYLMCRELKIPEKVASE